MRNTVSNDKTFFFFHILYFLQNNTSNGSSNTRSIAHDLISNTIFLRFDSDLANRVPSPLFIFECIHSFCFVFCLFVLLFSFSYSRAMSTLLVTMTTRFWPRAFRYAKRGLFSSLYESSLGGWALKIGKVTLNNFGFKYIYFFARNISYALKTDSRHAKWSEKNILCNFSCRFLNPNYFFQFPICNLKWSEKPQEQVKKYSVSKSVLTFHCLNKFV